MIEDMTYKQVEKSMAVMRRDVQAWKKDFKPDVDTHMGAMYYKQIKTFEMTFKAARSILERPENEFPMVSKRQKLDTCYTELKGWYEGIQVVMCDDSGMKKETEIKDLLPPASHDTELKKETEIKHSDTLKKEIEIKSEQRGGRREGAGRKSLGVKKPVSITLPEDVWIEIDNLIQNEKFKSYADYFRSLVLEIRSGG